MGILSEPPPQLLRRLGCKIPGIVVEDDVCLVGLGCQVVRPLGYFAEFVIRIIVMESLGHRPAGQVRLGVMPVQTQVAEADRAMSQLLKAAD